MSSWGNASIVTKTGTAYEVVEYPSRVLELYRAARAEGPGSLLELELPTTPTGKKLYLDPDQIESIRPSS